MVAPPSVRAQGGVLWADLDHETQPFGLATPGGVVSNTGNGEAVLAHEPAEAAAESRAREGPECDAHDRLPSGLTKPMWKIAVAHQENKLMPERGAEAWRSTPPRLLAEVDAESRLSDNLVYQERIGRMEASASGVPEKTLQFIGAEHARAA